MTAAPYLILLLVSPDIVIFSFFRFLLVVIFVSKWYLTSPGFICSAFSLVVLLPYLVFLQVTPGGDLLLLIVLLGCVEPFRHLGLTLFETLPTPNAFSHPALPVTGTRRHTLESRKKYEKEDQNNHWNKAQKNRKRINLLA